MTLQRPAAGFVEDEGNAQFLYPEVYCCSQHATRQADLGHSLAAMETPNYKVTAHSSYSASSAASSSNALSSPVRDRALKGRIPKVVLGPKIFENKIASFVNLDTVMKRNKGCCVFYVSKSKSKNKQDSDVGASFYRAPASQAKTKSKSSGDSMSSGKASGMMAKTHAKNVPVRTLKMKLKKPANSKVLLSSKEYSLF